MMYAWLSGWAMGGAFHVLTQGHVGTGAFLVGFSVFLAIMSGRDLLRRSEAIRKKARVSRHPDMEHGL